MNLAGELRRWDIYDSETFFVERFLTDWTVRVETPEEVRWDRPAFLSAPFEALSPFWPHRTSLGS